MRVVIVYESMFGNTHLIADAIAEGLAPGNEVTVVPVAQAGRQLLDGADLVVAGGPTHMHGRRPHAPARNERGALPRGCRAQGWQSGHPRFRRGRGGPARLARRPGTDPHAGSGIRHAVAGAPMLTGRASKTIAKLLERHGIAPLSPAESFLVTRDNQLRPGEQDRARRWGRKLAALLPTARPAG